MSGNELVKVLITTFNRREWARVAIESALAQTHENVRLVIVDDASTDGTAELAWEYSAKHPGRITVLAKGGNRGLGESIRLGLEMSADADFVAFLNDDDAWLPDKISTQLERFRSETGLSATITGAFFVDADGAPTGKKLGEGRFQPLDLAGLTTQGMLAYGSSIVVTKDVAERLRRTMPMLTNWDWYTLLVAAGMGRIELLKEELVEVRVSVGSMSTDVAVRLRDEVETFALFLQSNPDLLGPIGGSRGGRRQLTAMAAWRALISASSGDWRGYARYLRTVLRQRQPLATLGLAARSSLALLRLRTYRSV
jgi:glycosyltransferase involved in cell wall biosynthesis